MGPRTNWYPLPWPSALHKQPGSAVRRHSSLSRGAAITGSLRRVGAVFGPRSRTFQRTCGKWTHTLMNAPELSAGTRGECDDHATDQRGPLFQAYLCLTAGMQVGESTESVQGGSAFACTAAPW